jgi:threonine dehydrogenase-like Zn-dependent dehydrogenase
MRAITIEPRRPGSLRLEEVEDVRIDTGLLAVRTLGIGVCGTDRELIGGEYGDRPRAGRAWCSCTNCWGDGAREAAARRKDGARL